MISILKRRNVLSKPELFTETSYFCKAAVTFCIGRKAMTLVNNNSIIGRSQYSQQQRFCKHQFRNKWGENFQSDRE